MSDEVFLGLVAAAAIAVLWLTARATEIIGDKAARRRRRP